MRGGPSCVRDVSGVCCMRVSAWSGISYVYMRFKPWIYFGIHRVHWEYSCFCALAARRQADREFNSLKLYNGISNVANARGKRERERNQKTTGSPKEPKQQSEIEFEMYIIDIEIVRVFTPVHVLCIGLRWHIRRAVKNEMGIYWQKSSCNFSAIFHSPTLSLHCSHSCTLYSLSSYQAD